MRDVHACLDLLTVCMLVCTLRVFFSRVCLQLLCVESCARQRLLPALVLYVAKVWRFLSSSLDL
jgi:hypothetical protein